jgi:hypothetical protein
VDTLRHLEIARRVAADEAQGRINPMSALRVD